MVKVLIEAAISLILGVAAVFVSVIWINPLSFELGADVEALKTLSIRTDCPGRYIATITANVIHEDSDFWTRDPDDSPGALSVVIRHDPAESSASAVLSCTKFWLITSSIEVGPDAMAGAIVSKDNKELDLPQRKVRIEFNPSISMRQFSLATPDQATDVIALTLNVPFRAMAVGQTYGKKFVGLSYAAISPNVASTLTVHIPFAFEVNSTFPPTERLSLARDGVLLTVPANAGESVGAFFTDTSMVEKKGVILFLAAALLGTGVALIAEFFRALVRLFFGGESGR
jgi:hypothetical protein